MFPSDFAAESTRDCIYLGEDDDLPMVGLACVCIFGLAPEIGGLSLGSCMRRFGLAPGGCVWSVGLGPADTPCACVNGLAPLDEYAAGLCDDNDESGRFRYDVGLASAASISGDDARDREQDSLCVCVCVCMYVCYVRKLT
jgi:hypothetical protein